MCRRISEEWKEGWGRVGFNKRPGRSRGRVSSKAKEEQAQAHSGDGGIGGWGCVSRPPDPRKSHASPYRQVPILTTVY